MSSLCFCFWKLKKLFLFFPFSHKSSHAMRKGRLSSDHNGKTANFINCQIFCKWKKKKKKNKKKTGIFTNSWTHEINVTFYLERRENSSVTGWLLHE